MVRKEFDLEQIDLISKLLMNILFPEGFDKFNVDSFVVDGHLLDLKLNLIKLLESKKFVEASRLLFQELENNQSDKKFLQLAVWFYLKVNEFDDDVLKKNGFSRVEVLEGFERIEKLVFSV